MTTRDFYTTQFSRMWMDGRYPTSIEMSFIYVKLCVRGIH